MNKYYFIIIIYFLTVLVFPFEKSVAQSSQDKFTTINVNLKFIEHLIKIKIDSVRQSLDIKPLTNDSILYVAAKSHAEYMVEKSRLTHFENEFPKRRKPYDRVVWHGGLDYSIVAENVAMGILLTRTRLKHAKKEDAHIADTYDRAASDIVESWIHSVKHYENIINPNVIFTGVAVGFNPDKNKLYVAQKFGLRDWIYGAKENKEFFSYSDFVPTPLVNSFDSIPRIRHDGTHVWKLKNPENEECDECIEAIQLGERLRLKVNKKRIYLSTEDVELVKKLFQNRKDGLAIEVVEYRPYDCGNPQYYTQITHRNGQCVFNGVVEKPIYKKNLLKSWHKQKKRFRKKRRKKAFKALFNRRKSVRVELAKKWHPDSWSAGIGKISGNPTSIYEVNVVVIQNDVVCRVLHFGSYCGEQFTEFHSVNMRADENTRKYELPKIWQKYSIVVPFEHNKYEYNVADIKPLVDSLSSDMYVIKNVKIKAYASVEGKEQANKELQQKRAESIVNAIQSIQNSSIIAKIKTDENWALLNTQISEDSIRFSEFLGLSKTEVKTLLQNADKLKKYETILNKQRYAQIELRALFQVNDKNRQGLWLMEFNRILDSSKVDTIKFRHRYIDTLERMHYHIYKNIKAGIFETSLISKLNPPVYPPFERFWLNQLQYEYKLLLCTQMGYTPARFYWRLNKLTSLPTAPYLSVYNQLIFLIENWDKELFDNNFPPKKIWEELENNEKYFFLESTNSFGEMPDYEKLKLNYHFKAAAYYYSKLRQKKYKTLFNKSIMAIYEYYKTLQADTEIAMKFARFFVFYEFENIAISIIKPFATTENPDHDILIYYLKLSYVHPYEYPQSNYYSELIEAKKILTKEEWCGLFIGNCNISFQIFDNEEIRDIYCNECEEFENQAKKK